MVRAVKAKLTGQKPEQKTKKTWVSTSLKASYFTHSSAQTTLIRSVR